MTRKQIRKLLLSERGAAKRLAGKQGVTLAHVSMVLSGRKTSKRILDAAKEEAGRIAISLRP